MTEVEKLRKHIERLENALRRSPMPIRESVLESDEWDEGYDYWWHKYSSEDAIAEMINAICAPLPEARRLRDHLLESLGTTEVTMGTLADALRWFDTDHPRDGWSVSAWKEARDHARAALAADSSVSAGADAIEKALQEAEDFLRPHALHQVDIHASREEAIRVRHLVLAALAAVRTPEKPT